MTTKEDKRMFQKLIDDATTGADLSPGDPVCAWAVSEIQKLRKENEKLKEENDKWYQAHLDTAYTESTSEN